MIQILIESDCFVCVCYLFDACIFAYWLFISCIFATCTELKFVGQYLKEHKGEADKMKNANRAWMESEIRARILPSRGGKVPVGTGHE